ncbi:hypothetical protein PM082_021834 [Marasmius tenuissimus]|nr:hypothetical protein PM082_021834 [Marasmius tenuissimus]
MFRQMPGDLVQNHDPHRQLYNLLHLAAPERSGYSKPSHWSFELPIPNLTDCDFRRFSRESENRDDCSYAFLNSVTYKSSPKGSIFTVVALFVAYLLFVSVYRVAFHPLVKFPGPCIGALTTYYRAYYDVFYHGGWLDQLKVLHAKYGPVIRVGPNEIHFSTSGAYNEISRFPRDRDWYKEALSPTPDSLVTIADPQEASKRRARMGSYFSRRAVLELEITVQRNVDKLIDRLFSHAASSKPADLLMAYRAATNDIITGYLFAQKFNALDYEGFKHPFLVAFDDIASSIWLLKNLPLPSAFPVARLPDWIVKIVNPAAQPVLNQKYFVIQKIKEWEADAQMERRGQRGERAIFDSFLKPAKLAKYNEGTPLRSEEGNEYPWLIPRSQLMDECTSIQFAGTDTVGNACLFGTFHLLNDRVVLGTLRKELDEAWVDREDPMPFERLEKLPYLTAVIKESLRLSHGVPGPLPRIVNRPDTVILGCSIPHGTVVSSAAYFSHMNPTIFSDPHKFVPERWIGSDSRDLEKHLVAFSKGPRMCLGVNLAWCELYLIMGNVFRKLDMEIYDTTAKDLEFGDFFIPLFRGKHLQAIVKSFRE